jgi:hypothetical protein
MDGLLMPPYYLAGGNNTSAFVKVSGGYNARDVIVIAKMKTPEVLCQNHAPALREGGDN